MPIKYSIWRHIVPKAHAMKGGSIWQQTYLQIRLTFVYIEDGINPGPPHHIHLPHNHLFLDNPLHIGVGSRDLPGRMGAYGLKGNQQQRKGQLPDGAIPYKFCAVHDPPTALCILNMHPLK